MTTDLVGKTVLPETAHRNRLRAFLEFSDTDLPVPLAVIGPSIKSVLDECSSLISTNRELVKLLADVKTAVELVEVDLEAGNIQAKTRVKLAASRVRATIRALSPTQPKSGEVV